MTLQLFKFETSGSWLFDRRVLASRERSIHEQDYPNPVHQPADETKVAAGGWVDYQCSQTMTPECVWKGWKNHPQGRWQMTKQLKQVLFFLSLWKKPRWILNWYLLDRGGNMGKQEFGFVLYHMCTEGQLNKVLTGSLCKAISKVMFSLSHLYRITKSSIWTARKYQGNFQVKCRQLKIAEL